MQHTTLPPTDTDRFPLGDSVGWIVAGACSDLAGTCI